MYGFRFYFTPLPGFFSPFPHGTGSLSVTSEYLTFWGGPHYSFQQDFSCPAVLFVYQLLYNFDYRSLTFFACLSQNIRLSYSRLMYIRFLQFRSSLLSESLLLSFPHPTKIFQFGWSRLLSHTCSSNKWVLPFGFLRIVAYLQLPVAFRRSSRPSSPASA